MTAIRRDARADTLTLGVLGLAAASWVALLWLHGGAHPGLQAPPLDHSGHSGHASHGTPIVSTDWPLRAAGWVVMVVAMMLPPALPLLQTMRRLGAVKQTTGRVVAGAVGAFVGVWVAAGLGYWVFDLAASVARSALGIPTATAATIGLVVALVAAGAYQLSPAKRACLDACRSPSGMAMTRWTGHRPARDALRIGAAYAAICVGCCWALMLVTLVAGVSAMVIMVPMAALMAAERLLPRTRPLVPVIAVGLLAAAPLVLLWPRALS